MTSIAHLLVAGAIAAKYRDPLAASALAFTSHYILDSIPHWDIGTNWRQRSKFKTGTFAIGETLLGFGLSYLLFTPASGVGPFFAATIASVLPDWLETPWYIFFAKANKYQPKTRAGTFERTTFRLYKLQSLFHHKAQFPLGVLTQIATVGFFLFLLK